MVADTVQRWRRHEAVRSWRKGAAGERRTARALRRLERAGHLVLHDRALPRGKANVDHLVIGPAGVFVVDTKNWNRAGGSPSGAVASRRPFPERDPSRPLMVRSCSRKCWTGTTCPIDPLWGWGHVREEGADGEIEVDGFGFFGTISARDQAGAQEAAAAAITALTGRTVTGWDRDNWSRSIYGESSWYPCLSR
ncbi:nuclease-related domain-containing protein [Sphaerisporangium flaviroseum]|uniref:nuclease-related domain-containing protein n=1 Tax=Sphaerisporangium flaviroseum TaxID=509199 RepID=UPI0031F19600